MVVFRSIVHAVCCCRRSVLVSSRPVCRMRLSRHGLDRCGFTRGPPGRRRIRFLPTLRPLLVNLLFNAITFYLCVTFIYYNYCCVYAEVVFHRSISERGNLGILREVRPLATEFFPTASFLVAHRLLLFAPITFLRTPRPRTLGTILTMLFFGGVVCNPGPYCPISIKSNTSNKLTNTYTPGRLGLHCAILNIRSALNKAAQVHELIDSEKLDILILTETWIPSDAPPLINWILHHLATLLFMHIDRLHVKRKEEVWR